jgi:hypothetical protein
LIDGRSIEESATFQIQARCERDAASFVIELAPNPTRLSGQVRNTAKRADPRGAEPDDLDAISLGSAGCAQLNIRSGCG